MKEEEEKGGSLEKTGHIRTEEEGKPEGAKGRSLWNWGTSQKQLKIARVAVSPPGEKTKKEKGPATPPDHHKN